MNILSKIIGIIAFIIVLIGLYPLLGWLNWIVIPLALIGLFLGVFSKNTGGLTFNAVILIIAVLRLIIGGGFI